MSKDVLRERVESLVRKIMPKATRRRRAAVVRSFLLVVWRAQYEVHVEAGRFPR